MLSEEIKKMSDEEKRNLIISDPINYQAREIIKSIEDDDIKIDAINIYIGAMKPKRKFVKTSSGGQYRSETEEEFLRRQSLEKVELYKTLTSDDKKIGVMGELDDLDVYKLIVSFRSSEKIKEALKIMPNVPVKFKIIQRLNDLIKAEKDPNKPINTDEIIRKLVQDINTKMSELAGLELEIEQLRQILVELQNKSKDGR